MLVSLDFTYLCEEQKGTQGDGVDGRDCCSLHAVTSSVYLILLVQTILHASEQSLLS